MTILLLERHETDWLKSKVVPNIVKTLNFKAFGNFNVNGNPSRSKEIKKFVKHMLEDPSYEKEGAGKTVRWSWRKVETNFLDILKRGTDFYFIVVEFEKFAFKRLSNYTDENINSFYTLFQTACTHNEAEYKYDKVSEPIDIVAYIFWAVLLSDVERRIHEGKLELSNTIQILSTLQTKLKEVAEGTHKEKWFNALRKTREIPFVEALDTYITNNLKPLELMA